MDEDCCSIRDSGVGLEGEEGVAEGNRAVGRDVCLCKVCMCKVCV